MVPYERAGVSGQQSEIIASRRAVVVVKEVLDGYDVGLLPCNALKNEFRSSAQQQRAQSRHGSQAHARETMHEAGQNGVEYLLAEGLELAAGRTAHERDAVAGFLANFGVRVCSNRGDDCDDCRQVRGD